MALLTVSCIGQTILLVLTAIVLWEEVEAYELCQTGTDFKWRRYPESCNTLYFCFSGKAVTFRCPTDHVVRSNRRFCVKKDSDLDDCTSSQVITHIRVFNVPITCKPGERFPAEESCAKYSECVTSGNGSAKVLEQECPYPLLYDASLQKCSHYSNVKCETGVFVPKDPCEYDANKCGAGPHSGSCIPCNIRFPSCAGLPDGMNSWQGKEWSPYYVVCQQERISYHATCKSDKDYKIFHPDKRACVHFTELKDIVG